MSTKSEKTRATADLDRERAEPDQLRKQIDALVRGEMPKGPRSFRDRAKKPIIEQEIRQKGGNQEAWMPVTVGGNDPFE